MLIFAVLMVFRGVYSDKTDTGCADFQAVSVYYNERRIRRGDYFFGMRKQWKQNKQEDYEQAVVWCVYF